MLIVDYTFYTGTYKGTKLTQSEFGFIEDYASRKVNKHCFFRLTDYDFTDGIWKDVIKKCICKICDYVYDEETKRGLQGFTLADYSESYNLNEVMESNKKIEVIITDYLAETGLLYKGGMGVIW